MIYNDKLQNEITISYKNLNHRQQTDNIPEILLILIVGL